MSCALAGLSPAAFGQGNTVLPTDTVKSITNLRGTGIGKTFQLRLWQRLPARLYFNSSVETTFRLETNPFQYPLKRTLLNNARAALGPTLDDGGPEEKQAVLEEVDRTGKPDTVYRINPNFTAGWSVTPNTQVFATYFLIRDSVIHSSSLNSTTKALGIGAQTNITLSSKASLQPQIVVRELYQTQQTPSLDYLPTATMQYQFTPNLVGYLNGLLQLRFKHFISGSVREIDPFYTAGLNYQRGRWSFLASGTFVQNFRKQFGNAAIVPENNYSYVLDFEIDRQISKSLPGLQAIVRAEPVYNFHSHATPGLAGMDFRLYYGLRLTAVKPPLNATIDQLRQRYRRRELQEESPQSSRAPSNSSVNSGSNAGFNFGSNSGSNAGSNSGSNSCSSSPVIELVNNARQPIHGPLETAKTAAVDVVQALDRSSLRF